jgi:hypothetical protein
MNCVAVEARPWSHFPRLRARHTRMVVPALLTAAAVCVGVLVYLASVLITLTERRSAYATTGVAVGMSAGFIALVMLDRVVIAWYFSR